jgi:hypothetical protein
MTVYMTDYGPVRVSEYEAGTLRLFQSLCADSRGPQPYAAHIVEKAKLLIADCERVAKHKARVRQTPPWYECERAPVGEVKVMLL